VPVNIICFDSKR